MSDRMNFIGRTLGGRYTVVSEIGVGGMSVVYGAYDIETGKAVAVKVLDDSVCPTVAAQEQAANRFRKEIEAMSALSHPNIVNILAAAEDEVPMYFVMEYVEANTLHKKIEKTGALNLEETLHYTKQVLLALIHAHSNKIIHCDVKPQNVMLLDGGKIKLTDFGIARKEDSYENRESDTAVGTVYYISPEQAQGKKVDGRADIYSLGVMMYEMATGKLPFSAADTASVSRMHIEKTPLRPRVLDPDIPKGLEQIILHAMEKIPFMRFSDASAMLEAIKALERNPDAVFEFNLPPEETEKNEAEQQKNNNRVSGWVFALFAAALLFIVALIVTIIVVVIASGGKSIAPEPPIKELKNSAEWIWNIGTRVG